MVQRVLVCGAGGFIGTHLVRRLKRDGHWVRGVDLKRPVFSESAADEFVLGDLRDAQSCRQACEGSFDRVYQLAAEMGGVGYICAGANDADIMWNSAMINLNMVETCVASSIPHLFFPSSACIYPEYNQRDPANPLCSEDSAYPAAPDTEYGWEKLFAERLYSAFQCAGRTRVSIARLHNVYGPENIWQGGREKAVAAICRKVAQASDGGEIEIWGDGRQTRSFLYVDDCIDAIVRLMDSNEVRPVNIGSEEIVSIRDLAEMVVGISGKLVTIRFVAGPQGVRGRTSVNRRIRQQTGWEPAHTLSEGIAMTYAWIADQVAVEERTSRRMVSEATALLK